MERKYTKTDVGILICRLQVAELHEAHIDLIETVRKEHNKVILFLGLSPAIGTRNNPLDFECRKQMISEKFPDITILYIKDVSSDQVWSQNLDRMIQDHLLPSQTVTLYGGRDSFMEHYKGKFSIQELVSDRIISGSEMRKNISKKTKNTKEFREGVIWSVYNQYPKVFATVDIALINFKTKEILLGRKEDENDLRFIGGFSTPNSPSFEIDASRELQEETGVDVPSDQLIYAGSSFIDDWRYAGEIDKIKTTFFIAPYIMGPARPDDDIAELRWIKLDRFYKDLLVKTHYPLYDILKEYFKSKHPYPTFLPKHPDNEKIIED